MLKFGILSLVRQVLDQMLERAFICILEQLAYAER